MNQSIKFEVDTEEAQIKVERLTKSVRDLTKAQRTFTLKGYRKLTLTLICATMAFVLALTGCTIEWAYGTLTGACAAMCGANLVEHLKGGDS